MLKLEIAPFVDGTGRRETGREVTMKYRAPSIVCRGVRPLLEDTKTNVTYAISGGSFFNASFAGRWAKRIKRSTTTVIGAVPVVLLPVASGCAGGS